MYVSGQVVDAGIIKFSENKNELPNKGLALIQSDKKHKFSDSLIQILVNIGNLNFFNSENYTLTSLLQSGDFKLINSNDLKKELLRLLKMYEDIQKSQFNLAQALDNNYFPMIATKLDMTNLHTPYPDFFYSLVMKNYCAYTINDTNMLINQYKQALKQVNKLLKMIIGK